MLFATSLLYSLLSISVAINFHVQYYVRQLYINYVLAQYSVVFLAVVIYGLMGIEFLACTISHSSFYSACGKLNCTIMTLHTQLHTENVNPLWCFSYVCLSLSEPYNMNSNLYNPLSVVDW